MDELQLRIDVGEGHVSNGFADRSADRVHERLERRRQAGVVFSRDVREGDLRRVDLLARVGRRVCDEILVGIGKFARERILRRPAQAGHVAKHFALLLLACLLVGADRREANRADHAADHQRGNRTDHRSFGDPAAVGQGSFSKTCRFHGCSGAIVAAFPRRLA